MNPIGKWHDVVKKRDFKLLKEILSEDVVFHSPVVHTPQIGKEITFTYLKAAAEVFYNSNFSYVTEIIKDNYACLEFKLELEGIHINGLDLITWNENNQIIEFKVFIRPLKGVQTMHALMGSMLDKIKE